MSNDRPGPAAPSPARVRIALALFVAAIFSGAWQLFLVQPLIAKLLLPRLGGSPSVWITCMLFFQAGLLGGYAYAHLLARRTAIKAQVAIHAAVVLLPALVLPLSLAEVGSDPRGAEPVVWLLGALAVTVGAPYFALATTGPLVQRWFAWSAHPRARDPYFLYAASNLGSFGALVAYPTVVEPTLTLSRQTAVWSAGYAVYAVLVLACAAVVLAAGRARGAAPENLAEPASAATPWPTRLRWVLLAFVPSSLVLGATQYVTTDLAAFPLLWVVPLALYLASFVLVFSSRQVLPRSFWSIALAVLCTAAAMSFWAMSRPYAWLLLTLHPLVVLAAGMVCHGRLADERPEPARLTEFYLLIALGGVLGGLFNAVIAPLVFRSVVEYPLILVLACLLRPWPSPRGGEAARRRALWLDFALPAALAVAALGLERASAALDLRGTFTVLAVQALVPCAIALTFVRRPVRFALALAVLLAVGSYQTAIRGRVILQERTFFGVHRVIERPGPPFQTTDASGQTRVFQVPFRFLYHGATRHGLQALEEPLRRTPTAYFHPTGPIGQVFGSAPALRDVAVVGLGAGTLAAYGEPDRRFTFYEIDPEVVRIARDPRYFTFVADSASACSFVVGDGRLSLENAPDAAYDLLVIDAFTSDAIPVHLLTREAVALYLRKLRPGGMLALHITNQNLDLTPVVNAIVADLGLHGLIRDDQVTEPRELIEGKDPSTWAVVAADPVALAPLAGDLRWTSLPWDPRGGVERRYLWTDDASSVFSVLVAY